MRPLERVLLYGLVLAVLLTQMQIVGIIETINERENIMVGDTNSGHLCLVVGCGGVAFQGRSMLARWIAENAPDTVVLFDPDSVEPHNWTRQWYGHSAGTHKAYALAESLDAALQATNKCAAFAKRFSPQIMKEVTQISGPPVLITAFVWPDNYEARVEVLDWLHKYKEEQKGWYNAVTCGCSEDEASAYLEDGEDALWPVWGEKQQAPDHTAGGCGSGQTAMANLMGAAMCFQLLESLYSEGGVRDMHMHWDAKRGPKMWRTKPSSKVEPRAVSRCVRTTKVD